jgi:hypothetical protein
MQEPATRPNRISYFDAVPVLPETGRIMRRLGYKHGRTVLSPRDEAFMERAIQEGIALCQNRGAAGRFRVASRTPEDTVLEDGTTFHSELLSKLLAGSKEVLLMAGTAGWEIANVIKSRMSDGDAALAVVYDAVGSQSADRILDWIMDFYRKILLREGLKLTKHRYSPGYGDLHLSHQKPIFRLLEVERLEVKLNDSLIMEPEKSVLAIAGIEKLIDKSFDQDVV